MIAKHVIYKGRVQGVGFRYTCYRLAGNHEVTGFVKNLPDGSVDLILTTNSDFFRFMKTIGPWNQGARKN